MPKPSHIELPGVEPIPILYEDRAVLAIDKPRGWMLVPYSWQRTNWNLQAAIVSSISAGDFWSRARGLKFLKFVHRLDAETTGILLFAKSQGAVEVYSELFEDRRMEKTYLAVVHGSPKQTEWTCHLKLGPAPGQGRMLKHISAFWRRINVGHSSKRARSRGARIKSAFTLPSRQDRWWAMTFMGVEGMTPIWGCVRCDWRLPIRSRGAASRFVRRSRCFTGGSGLRCQQSENGNAHGNRSGWL